MDLTGLIILITYFVINISAILYFNLVDAKQEGYTPAERILPSIVFLFGGIVYWPIAIYKAIKRRK